MLQPKSDCKDEDADDHQRLAPAQTVPNIAELGQSGIGQMVPLNIVERTDKSGKGDIPLEQSKKRENERYAGEGDRQEASDKRLRG